MKKIRQIQLVRPRQVLARKNIEVRLPFQLTILWIVALDHFCAVWYWWLIIGTYLFFQWAWALYHFSWDKKVHLENILEAVILPQYINERTNDQE